jgi:methyl-accepting chemotaxis protein
MKLKKKILYPLMIIPLAGVLGYFVMHNELQDMEDEIHLNQARNLQNQVIEKTRFAANQALAQAALFSRLPVVIEAYETAHRGNIEQVDDRQAQAAREALRDALEPHLQGYSDAFQGRKLKLHFHLPNGRSLLRAWRDKQTQIKGKGEDISDDISSFRSTVMAVNQSGKPVTGIELGRGGFVVRGLAPVKDRNGKQLGSVEVLSDFKILFENIAESDKSTQNSHLMLFMNADLLQITTKLQDSEQYPVIDDQFVGVYIPQWDEYADLIDKDLLNAGRTRLSLQNVNGEVISTFPILDYRQQQVGVMLYIHDARVLNSKLSVASWSLIITLAIILIATGIWMALITSHLIIRPLGQIHEFLHQVKIGNNTLELDMPSDDEVHQLGRSVNQLIVAQRHVLNQIHRSGVQVTSSATELAATAKEHKATIMTQVDSTETVVRSVDEITRLTKDLASTVEQVAEMSAQTASFATSGQDNLSHMKEAMGQMEVASKSISSKLEAINEKNENITSVVTTITKVAEQTNLLSLNAAIEAEKAGEYGHGFNVVAREIRRLADQTAVATLDIDRMVKEMQSAVSAGVMEMDKFISVVRHSAEDVGKISGQLTRIIEQVQALSPNFESVKIAMEHQSEHANQINAEIVALGEGMRQTADTLQESFQAIEQLNEASRGLQNEVEHFKTAGLKTESLTGTQQS